MEEQVVAWHLPPAPIKVGDSRSANWDGLGQVELDAVEPKKLQRLCQAAIDEIFDVDKWGLLVAQEAEERTIYQSELREFIHSL